MPAVIDVNDVVDYLGERIKELTIENAKLIARVKMLEREDDATVRNS
jgi:hypothetical protein